jgi:hypothetical protein
MAKQYPRAKKLAAEANGYKPGAHAENDKKTGLKKYKDEVLVLRDWTLENYVTYVRLASL